MTFLERVSRYYRAAYGSGHFPSPGKLLKYRHRILAYRGFLGDGNFGDELVFQAAQSLFRDCLLVPVQHHMPLLTRLLLKAGWLTPKGEILGGGTLIGPRVELSSEMVGTFVHGTGVKSFYSDHWVEVLAARMVFGGVRGPASRNRLADKGFVTEIDGDAAFHFFQPMPVVPDRSGAVLINLGTHNVESKMAQSRAEVHGFIADLLKRGMRVEFLPFHRVDEKLGQFLVQQFPEIRMHRIPVHYSDAAAVFRDASFAVGERLHFTVTALLCGCPCYSIMYEPKHEELLESLDCLAWGARPEAVTRARISAHHERRHEFDWTVVQQKLSAYKRKQEQSARTFLTYVGIGN